MVITNEDFAIVGRDTHIGKWIIESKRLDFDQNSLPQMLPYITSSCTVLDIGANVGAYAYAFAKVAKNVLCFEPNDEAFECLEYNMNRLSNVECFSYPITDKQERYNVVCENDNIGMAFILENKKGKVLSATVDSLQLTKCDFIKIDVEGFELAVLKGAQQTINKLKPILVIEINDHTLKRNNSNREEIFDWLTENKYLYRNIYKEQGLLDEQLDIICFHA